MNSREMPGWFTGLVGFAAFAAAMWGLWCTVIAFMGGVLPIPFVEIEVSGGVVTGLLMLFVGEPILVTVTYWVFMLVFMPLALLFSKRTA